MCQCYIQMRERTSSKPLDENRAALCNKLSLSGPACILWDLNPCFYLHSKMVAKFGTAASKSQQAGKKNEVIVSRPDGPWPAAINNNINLL